MTHQVVSISDIVASIVKNSFGLYSLVVSKLNPYSFLIGFLLILLWVIDG